MKKQVSGLLIFASLLWYVLAMLMSLTVVPSVILCWVTVIMMWPTLNRTSKTQSLTLFVIGVVLLAISLHMSGYIDWWQAVHVNLPLVMMFASITFLTANQSPTKKNRFCQKVN